MPSLLFGSSVPAPLVHVGCLETGKAMRKLIRRAMPFGDISGEKLCLLTASSWGAQCHVPMTTSITKPLVNQELPSPLQLPDFDIISCLRVTRLLPALPVDAEAKARRSA